MSFTAAAQKRYAAAKRLSFSLGRPAATLFADSMWCARRHGTSAENYGVLRFYELNEAQRRTFLTAGRSKGADRLLNQSATVCDKLALGNKARFNAVFSDFIRRDFLYAPDASTEEIEKFLQNHPAFFIKPVALTQGQGILRINSADIENPGEFISAARQKKLLLEQPIIQHPKIDEISPGCVNSLRIIAARDVSGAVRLIGAALRCGGVNAVVDNFHSGGAAYTVELSSGKIAAPGRDNETLRDYVNHPGSLVHMPGMEIPNFEAAVNTVRRAMAVVPSMGYVGWDLAVTADGAELIEGNFSYPGGNIIQFDGVGKYPLVLQCIAGR